VIDYGLLYTIFLYGTLIGIAESVLSHAFRRKWSTAALLPPLVIPAIAMAVGAASSYLKNKAAGKSAKEQQALYNEWLKNRETGVNEIIEKATAQGFNPFGPQVTTQAGTSTSSTSQYTAPKITPQYKELEGLFRNLVTQSLKGGSALPEGYLGSATRGINQAFQGGQVAAQNLAARRGLSGEQALSIGEPFEAARAGKIADVANQIPLLERQLRNEDIARAAGLTEQFGKGTSTTGTTTGATSGTFTAPPNLGLLAQLLLPPSPTAGKETGISTAGGVGGDLASMLMSLWASKGTGSAGGGSTGGLVSQGATTGTGLFG